MRGLVAVVVLAGCRLHFDEHAPADAAAGDAAGDGTPTATLACNAPMKVSDAVAADPHLSATPTDRGVFALWIDDDGAIASAGVELLAPDVAVPAAGGLTPGPWSSISVAVSGTRLLAAVGTTDLTATGGSILHPYDVTTGLSAGNPVMNRVRATSPRALAVSGSGFVLAGTSFAPTSEVDVVSIDGTGATKVAEAMITGSPANAHVATLGATGFVVVAWGSAIACTARIGRSNGLFGPTVTWGSSGMCLEPAAIPALDGAHVLLVRKDTSDGDLNHQIAMISGNTMVLPGEGKLAGVADEPRGAAVASGYWVGYRTSAGQLEVIFVDPGAAKGTPHTIAPTPTLDAHDVVTFAGEPYALWFDNGLWLAHLCP